MLKDHLGNVRMVLTEEQKQDIYPAATLENTTYNGGTAISKEDDFYTINASQVVPQSIATGIAGYQNQNNNGIPPNNNPYSNASANSEQLYKIHGNDASKTGLGITLKVMAGDKIDILGKSYYFEASSGAPAGTNEQMITEILSGLLGTPGGVVNTSGHGPVTTTILNGQSATTGGINALLNQQATNTGNVDPEPPRAFINYIFFDEQFKYVSGGFSGVGTQNELKSHFLQNLAAQKNGYVYIYASNQSPIKVFFDNLQVVHTRGAILEETHYYPFGLSQAGITSKALSFDDAENKRKFNGIEHNSDFDINMYDAFYRNLDPQIGRFWQVDPKIESAESWSSYSAMLDNPIRYADPLGDSAILPVKNYYHHQKPEVTSLTLDRGKALNSSSTSYKEDKAYSDGLATVGDFARELSTNPGGVAPSSVNCTKSITETSTTTTGKIEELDGVGKVLVSTTTVSTTKVEFGGINSISKITQSVTTNTSYTKVVSEDVKNNKIVISIKPGESFAGTPQTIIKNIPINSRLSTNLASFSPTLEKKVVEIINSNTVKFNNFVKGTQNVFKDFGR